jgi:ubiquinone/menaquinone biosynthesis C-methylase UbiE
MVGNDVVIEAFTELAPRYEEVVDREVREYCGLGYVEFITQLVRMASLEEGNVVLDVATGTALGPLEMVDKVRAEGQIVGLDITLTMLKYGQKNTEAAGLSSYISLVCASAMEMPFADGTFDAVVCGLGMHHMDVPQMLFETRRVLKKGGNLIMADMGAPNFWRSFRGRVLIRILALHYKLTHSNARGQAEVAALPNVHTASEWHTILSDFGFMEIEISESPPRHFWYPCALIMRAVKGERHRA